MQGLCESLLKEEICLLKLTFVIVILPFENEEKNKNIEEYNITLFK